ncbi:MAG TPA: hypothetical protein VLA85_10750, partial [Verrucomicrobiae bacterium]|nr:hypothetical protein [Verrucomicrobiae bacterium]
LPGAAAAATTLTISSNYGIGLHTVTVTDVTTGTPLQTCNFLLKPTAPCIVPNVTTGHTIALTAITKSGFVISAGTGLCASIAPSPPYKVQFAAPTGTAACGIFAGSPMTVTANGPGVTGVVTPAGATCTIAQPSKGKSCQLAVAPGALKLTIGLQAGITVTGGTGLCTGATAAPFTITVPAAGPYACGINSAPPSALPANGWWWTNTIPSLHYDTGIRYGLQINPAAHALYGIVSTFRTDGSAVWYVLNATADAQNQAYQGTATEFSNLSGSVTAGAPRPQTIVANVKLTFASTTLGSLSWTPRAGGPTVVKPIERFPISTTLQPPPNLAPVPGLYNPTQNPGGPGYFLEMQGPTTPHGYIGLYTYGGNGLATWSVTLQNNQVATAFPSKAAQKGWQLSTQFLTYTGGAPITLPAKQPKTVLGPTIVATMGPTANTVKVGGGNQTPLSINSGWGLASSPYWLQIVNNSKTITNPYVTFLSTATPNFSYVNRTTGQLATFPPFTSVPLINIANGALLAPSTSLGGNLYISDKPLQVGNTAQKTCKAIGPASHAAPSPLSNSGDCNLGTHWQFLELGGDYDATYINLYSIPLAFNQGSAAYGNATPAQLSNLELALGNLSGGKSVYPVGSQGKPSFIRAIGPANANGATDQLLALFPSFNAYITSAFNPTTGFPVTPINIANSYSANVPKGSTTICAGNGGAAFKTQSYSTSSIKYLASTLTITGTGSVVGPFTISAVTPLPKPPVGCGGSTNPLKCYSTAVTLADFSAALYTAVLSYSVSGTKPANVCLAGQAESNGANDVFSLVVRDLLVSLASGFANSTVASPIAGKTYGTMTSAQWSSSAAKLFAGVQPAKPYYNPWGAAVFNIFGNSRIYGFQYSDYFNPQTSPLGNPLMPVRPSIPIQLLILNGG